MLSFFKRHALCLRVLSVLLIAVTVLLYAAPMPASTAADSGPDYTRKFIYKWDRFWTKFDGPEEGTTYPAMFIWPSIVSITPLKLKYYATIGTSIGNNSRSFFGQDITNDPLIRFTQPVDSFYTDSDMKAWSITGQKIFENNESTGLREIDIRLSNGLYAYDDTSDYYLAFQKNKDDDTQFTLVGVDPESFMGYDYSENIPYGYASLIDTDDSWYDRYMLVKDTNRLTLERFTQVTGAFDFDAPDFLLYFAKTKEEYACISKNYTVKAGTTLQIKNNSWLENGVTLTVEPGAVLSISGKFINDGMINNCGTVLINEGATISSFGTRGETSGSIFNYGSKTVYVDNTTKTRLPCEGNLLIMPNARVNLPDVTSKGEPSKARLELTDAAILVNYGTLFVPGTIKAASSVIQNKASGVICSHCKMGVDDFVAMSFSWKDRDDYNLEELSDQYNSFDYDISRSVVLQNDGYWHNFTQCYNMNTVQQSGTGTVD